MAMVKSAVGI